MAPNTPSPASFRVNLLGSFTIERDGQVVDRFGSRQDELILAYLALHDPTPVARRELVTVIWPHVAPSTALKHLSVALYTVKARLRAIGMAEGGVDSVRTSLKLMPGTQVDVAHFLESLARATKAPGSVEQRRALEAAIAMYGAGLLPDSRVEWLAPYKREFEQLYRHAVEALASPDKAEDSLRLLREQLPPVAWKLSAEAEDARLAGPAGAPGGGSAREAVSPDLLAFVAQAGAALDGPEAQVWTRAIDERMSEIIRAVTLATGRGEPLHAAAVIMPIWRYWTLRGTAADGLEQFAAVLRAGYEPAGEERGRFHHAMGALAAYAGKFAEAREHLQVAIETWRQLGSIDDELRSRANLALTYFQDGNFTFALRTFEQCLSMARAMGDVDLQIRLLLDAACAAIRLRDAPKALQLLSSRMRILEPQAAQRSRDVAGTLAHRASAHLTAGDYARAVQDARQALQLVEATDDVEGLILAEQLLGLAGYLQGDQAEAEPHLNAAIAHARRAKLRTQLGVSLSYLALVQEAQDRSDVATQTMGDAEMLLASGADAGALSRARGALEDLRSQRTRSAASDSAQVA